MSGIFDEPEGATPLGPDERVGLKQTWITTRQDLNEAEQANVLAGAVWARARRQREILSLQFVVDLHRQMFDEVWNWAGTFRSREVNIGVDPRTIQVALRALLDDVRYWTENNTHPPDEIAVRLHHQMVWIHPFPNGNGRHTRMMADLLAGQLGAQPFSWGGRDLANASSVRKKYLAALRLADRHDLEPLLAFARS